MGSGTAVFGRVVFGWDVVGKIYAIPTGMRQPYGEMPMEKVVVKQVRIVDRADLQSVSE